MNQPTEDDLYENKSYTYDLKRFYVTIVFVHWWKKKKNCKRTTGAKDSYFLKVRKTSNK